ncbi:N-acetylglucosamine-6-phosphate deacetylase [Streptomyces misionensis JCM 4497]
MFGPRSAGHPHRRGRRRHGRGPGRVHPPAGRPARGPREHDPVAAGVTETPARTTRSGRGSLTATAGQRT